MNKAIYYLWICRVIAVNVKPYWVFYCAVNEEDVTGYRGEYIKPEWCELKEVSNNSKLFNEIQG